MPETSVPLYFVYKLVFYGGTELELRTTLTHGAMMALLRQRDAYSTTRIDGQPIFIQFNNVLYIEPIP